MPLARRHARSPIEVAGRVEALRTLVLVAAGDAQATVDQPFSPRESALLARQPDAWDPQDVVDAIWRGEALGTLAWALGAVAELPAYDRPFDHVELARGLRLEREPSLRPVDALERARESARLWHWRARTTLLQGDPTVRLPERWASFDQLIAAAAMRGHEEGLLPAPHRGDFPAFGTSYRQLDGEQRGLALSIASERHVALTWLCGDSPWDETPLDT